MKIPPEFLWLADEDGPRVLKEMLKLYGTIETPGPGNNPLILRWAEAVGLGHVYRSDETPWCGLTMSYACAQAGYDYAPRGNALWARNWLAWGNSVPLGKEMLGDILVFQRGNAGHVALCVGETATHFWILGGNQNDSVNIKSKAKADLLSGRRCAWRVNQPDNIRKVFMLANGQRTSNEAVKLS
jgi:uncharacterized protein (TIGR02594 family)